MYLGDNMKRKIISMLVCILLLVIVIPVTGEKLIHSEKEKSLAIEISEDNMWSMFRHDASHTGFSVAQAPSTNNLKWTGFYPADVL